ncbi:AraC family transcriptional regulator [Cognatishimia sp. F0-27]|uniref:helix-turn-helix transcriptional regulator n=1 Tax=Cognatishimia sp. F0-27 TaxID=2816855 RepID=UPI001D0C0410|nr:AraC family transcriptional regulator [Cognatishimia sp. F0-27]MCC1491325.1 helix-turn-helix domain-containing protein [Cognatishimia sp. F0-27]
MEDPTSANVLEAPALVCLPDDARQRIKLLAGSSGAHLAIDGLAMANVLGNRPEAVELRVMLREPIALPLGEFPEQDLQITQAVHTIGLEAQRRAPGRLVIIEAQLRCLLIHLWRHSYDADAVPVESGPRNNVLWRFRQLVEINFRSRWRVTDYANALGTTTDRLHNMTTQQLKRTPLQLIHERTHREAKALLTRSNMTLDQIAAYLGFKASAQFSAFFRKLEGVPPGQFRLDDAVRQAEPVIEQTANFTDWP